MKYFLYIAALLALLVLQSGLVGHLGFGTVGNLPLIFVVLAVTLLETRESLVLALICGLMLDFVSGSRDGTMMICMLAVFGFSYFYMYKLVPREPNLPILFSCVLFNSIVFAFVFVLANRLLSELRLDTAVDVGYLLGKKLLSDAAANLVFAYPVYAFLNLTLKLNVKLEQVLIKN